MSFPSMIFPGTREPVPVTTAGAPVPTTVPEGPSTMDAATIAERRREGGGAPSQRRGTRTLFGWQFRSTHV